MNNNFDKITDEKDVIYKNINNIANSQLKTYITTSNNETINLNYKTIIVNNKDSTSINPVNIIIPKPESNQINVIYTIITKYIPSGVIDGLSLPVIITLINSSTSTTEIKLETNINTVKIIYTNDIWINLNDYNNDLDKMDIVNLINENQILDLNHINTIVDNSTDDIILILPEQQDDINVYKSNTVYNIQILYNTGCEVMIKSDKNGYINLNSNNNNVSLLFDKENTKKWIILNNNSLSFFPCINSLKNSNSEVKVKDGVTDVLLALPNNKPFQLISTINSFQTTIAILYGTKIQFYNKDYNTQKWYFSSDFEKPDNTIFVDELVSSSISISPDSSLFCLCCFLNTYGNIIRTFYIYRYSTLNNKYELINNKLGIQDEYNDNTSIFGEKIVIDINNKIYVNKVKNINTVTKGLNDTINYSYFYVYKIVKYVDVLDNNITKEKIELETIVNSSELLIKNNPINNYVLQNAKFIVLGNNFEVSPSGNSILLTCPYYNSSNVYEKTFVLSIQKIDDPEAKSPYIIESYFENNNKHFGDIMLLKNDDTLICNFLDSNPEGANTYIMKVFIFKKYNKKWEEEYRIININFSFNNNDNNPYYDIDNNKILLPYMDISGDSNILSLVTSNTQMAPFFSVYKREGFLWRNKSIINNPVVVNNDTYFIGTKIYMNNQGNNMICLYAYKNENNEFNVSITEIY